MRSNILKLSIVGLIIALHSAQISAELLSNQGNINIVACLDGTLGSAKLKNIKIERNQDRTTNPFRLCLMLKKSPLQNTFYVEGVKNIVTGYGISEIARNTAFKITKLYNRALAKVKDKTKIKVFIFGFSRGAASAQKVSAYLNNEGLYGLYRAAKGNKVIAVEFLGLWDMVYATISETLRLKVGKRVSDVHLSTNVSKAVHLVGLNDTRRAFEVSKFVLDKYSKNKVKTVYFAGSHLNIGGASLDRRLPNITLQYMINASKELGLEFDKTEFNSSYWDSLQWQDLYLGKIKNTKFERYRKLLRQNSIPEVINLHHSYLDVFKTNMKTNDSLVEIQELIAKRQANIVYD